MSKVAMLPERMLVAAEAIRASVSTLDPALGSLPIAGLGWATVDLDRTIAELAPDAGDEGFAKAPRDDLLGATARIHVPSDAGGAALVLLEPDTEGRLAATLARFGEGLGAVYLVGRDPAGPGRLGTAAGGPLGVGRLIRGLPWFGPNVIVLDPAGSRR